MTLKSALKENWPFIVFGVLVGFLLAEGLIRIADPQPIGFAEKNSLLGWSNSPNARIDFVGAQVTDGNGILRPQFRHDVQINSLGLRDVERKYEKDTNTIRILALGDSMVAGFEVDLNNTFTQKLEKKLSLRLNKKVEVINAGVRGYSSVQEYLYLQTEGKKFDADIVLLNYTHNDVLDNVGAKHGIIGLVSERPTFTRDNSGKLTLIPPYQNQQGIVESIQYFFGPQIMPKYCRLCNIFLIQLTALFQKKSAPAIDNKPFVYYTRDIDANDMENWVLAKEVISKIKTEAESQGSIFVFSIFPSEPVIDDESWNDLLKENPEMIELTPEREKTQKIIGGFAREEKMFYLDSTPQFREARKANISLYWKLDGHFTPEGHDVYANALADFLIDTNVIN